MLLPLVPRLGAAILTLIAMALMFWMLYSYPILVFVVAPVMLWGANMLPRYRAWLCSPRSSRSLWRAPK